jgi:hypothetical protein
MATTTQNSGRRVSILDLTCADMARVVDEKSRMGMEKSILTLLFRSIFGESD